jgi:hypothetical protein
MARSRSPTDLARSMLNAPALAAPRRAERWLVADVTRAVLIDPIAATMI